MTQALLEILYSGTEMLLRELGNGRAVAAPLLSMMLGILIGYLLRPKFNTASPEGGLPNCCQNLTQANLDRPSTFVIALTLDECSQAAVECITRLVHEVSLNRKTSSPPHGRDMDSSPECRPGCKRRRPYPGYYKDLLQGKTKAGYLSE